MQLTLRCTNVMEHPNNTQSVSLQEPPAHVPGAPGPRAVARIRLIQKPELRPCEFPCQRRAARCLCCSPISAVSRNSKWANRTR
jgi:hypothetical protein